MGNDEDGAARASTSDASPVMGIDRAGDAGVRVTELRVGDCDLVVLSLPIPGLPDAPELTRAEREVCLGILAGESNADIAGRRGTSVSTVANQVGSIFAKLGVNTRAELILRCLGTNGPGPE